VEAVDKTPVEFWIEKVAMLQLDIKCQHCSDGNEVRSSSKTGTTSAETTCELLLIPSVSCPEGWIGFGVSCYKAFSDPQSWTAARQECKDLDTASDLVAITSALEQKFLDCLTEGFNTFWLGAYRDTENPNSNAWVWSNGIDAWRYQNWEKYFPSRQSSVAGTVYIYSTHFGVWRDVEDTVSSSVCEKPIN